MSPPSFVPHRDIPDLDGRVIFITGGTHGIGKAAIEELVHHNAAHIYFSGRDHDAANALISQHKESTTRLTFIPCDLRHIESVKQAARVFKSTESKLHVFISNAGIMTFSNSVTKDGLESQFAVNHLGNAALFLELLPIMLSTSEEGKVDVRYVSVSSALYALHPRGGINFSSLQNPKARMPWTKLGLYGQSKLANILFANQVSKRYPQIKAIALHPGVVDTHLADKAGFLDRLCILPAFLITPCGRMMPISEREGSYSTLWAATVWDGTEKPVRKNGPSYYLPVGKQVRGRRSCNNERLAETLWEWTLAASEADLTW